MLFNYSSNISYLRAQYFLISAGTSSFQGIGSSWRLVWVEIYEGQRMRYTCFRKVFYERSRINVTARDLMERKTRAMASSMLLTLGTPW